VDNIDTLDTGGYRVRMGDEFISANEAADRLELALNTVKRRIDGGILRGYKDPITHHYVVSRRAVDELLEQRAALRRSALLAGATRPRREYVSPAVAAKRR